MGHNKIQNPGRIRPSVDHISKDIQSILIAESDLLQHSFEKIRHSVNIGHHISPSHSSTAFSKIVTV